jgi:pyruvate formate lyase activating enzyme
MVCSAIPQTVAPTGVGRIPAPTAPIASFSRGNLTDWPGRRSATISLAGCSLSCACCSVPELKGRRRAVVSTDSVVEYLFSARDSLSGVVVTGGEPTEYPYLYELLDDVRSVGLPTRLDTNGMAPELIVSLLGDGLVDFVALDVKTSPERYDRVVGSTGAWPRVEASINAVIASGVDHEFRTTCYPYAVSAADMPVVASALSGGRRYVLQQFRSQRTLDPAAASVTPYALETLRRAALCCSVHIPTIVRGS